MAKQVVKRCTRPQCLKIYSEDFNESRWCDCGAPLQTAEIDVVKFKKTRPVHQQTDTNRKPVKEEKKPVKKTEPVLTAKGKLVLLLDDDKEVEFILGRNTIIGRATEESHPDIDLSSYDSAKYVSRRHAIVYNRPDGFYVENCSRNHSLHVNEKALAFSEKILLSDGDMVILGKKFLFEFEKED